MDLFHSGTDNIHQKRGLKKLDSEIQPNFKAIGLNRK